MEWRRALVSQGVKVIGLQPLALLAVSAAVAFATAVLLLLLDRVGAAAIAATLFVSCVAFANLPLVEFLETAGVKLRLRKEIDRAEELKKEIAAFRVETALALYPAIISANHNVLDDTEVRKTLRGLMATLADAGVSREQRIDLAQVLFERIAQRLCIMFEACITDVVYEHRARSNPEANAWVMGIANQRDAVCGVTKGFDLQSILGAMVPLGLLSAGDAACAMRVAKKFQRILDDSFRAIDIPTMLDDIWADYRPEQPPNRPTEHSRRPRLMRKWAAD